MKSFAGSLMLSFCLTVLAVVPDKGRVRCTCRPSPPGGVTECQSGQIAVCSGRGGICKGSCISLSAQLQPLQYSAALLTRVLDLSKEITVEDLKKDRKSAKKALEGLIDSSNKGTSDNIEFGGKVDQVSVGLTEVAIKKLRDAIGALYVKLNVPIPLGIGRPRWSER